MKLNRDLILGGRGGTRRLGRFRRAPLAVLGMAVMLTASACVGDNSGSGGGSGTTLRIAYQVIPNGDPIVKQQKWLESSIKGVKIEWKQFDAAQDVITAMASRSVDVGLIGSTGVANASAQGLDFQVPWIFDVEGDNEALVVKTNKGINSINDLAGKTIATPFGSTTQYSLFSALQQAGLQGKVKVLDMKPPEALAAWSRGDIDAAYIWEPTLSKMRQNGGKVILTSRQLATKGVVTADLAVVSKSYAKQNPTVVRQWLAQENRAVQMIKSEPDKAAGIVATALGISASDAASQMKELVFLDGKTQLSPSYLGPAGKPGALADTLSKTCTFLKAQKLVASCPGMSAFGDSVNGEYLSKAISGS